MPVPCGANAYAFCPLGTFGCQHRLSSSCFCISVEMQDRLFIHYIIQEVQA
jgi:hypothetical protein